MNTLKVKLILFGSLLGLLHPLALAKDLGEFGETFAIVEQDLLEVIERKLRAMQHSGELEQHQHFVQNTIRARIANPKAKFLPETKTQRVFFYDPSITVEEDLSDGQGHIFRRKGEQINPLDTYSFRETWMFFDGNSEKQRDFVLEQAKEKNLKLIMIGGMPLEFMEKNNIPIYFDQSGWLIEKFKIAQVPAEVEQVGKNLKITELDITQWKK